MTKRRTRLGNVFVLSAPSGAGKSTLVKYLMDSVPGLTFSVSHTTRQPRPGEKNGREYHFVTRKRFERMIAAGDFVEWADVHGNLYGTSWKELRSAQNAGLDIVLDIDVQGHSQVRERLPEAVSIFLLPPSYKELERRLRKRHLDAPESIRGRLANARDEMSRWPEYDYLVVNDRLPAAKKTMQAIVLAARSRRQSQEALVREICRTFGG